MDTSAEQTANKGYFVTDTAGQIIAVCFEPLTADDTHALNGDDWRGARFGAVWKEWAAHNLALKLVRCDSSDPSLFGIVKLGTAAQITVGATILRDSLIETAPAHQFGTAGRRYRGIGRILIARLVMESKAQGANGRVLVLPVEGSTPFYLALGFQVSRIKYRLRLEEREAETLLKTCLSASLLQRQNGEERKQ